jgi:hypothetical protein
MDRTVIQCNIFTAMVAHRNFHFIDEACRLLVRVRNSTDIYDKIAYDKLLNTLLECENKKVLRFIEDNKIKYLCVENSY